MLIYPLRKLWISADTVDHGYNAYDWGWWDSDPAMPNDSGRNPQLYAMADGIVITIVNSHPDDPDMEGYGNYIVIKYPNEGYCSLYAHIKKSSYLVKVGDKVTQGQPVCRMGNSGYSFGNHLHLELCKGGTFVRHGGIDYVKNKVVYATNWHVVDSDTQKDYGIAKMIIEPVDKDITKNQVHVTGGDLRIRKAPATGEVVGFANKGYYNATETVEQAGYIWAKVDNYWIAANTDVSEYIEATFVPVPEDKNVNQAEVIGEDLRIRIEPSTSSTILGYAPKGFYNVEETKNEKDYIWFKCCGAWIACTDDVVYHAAQEDKDAEIKRLKEEVATLEAEVVKLEADLANKTAEIVDLTAFKDKANLDMAAINDIVKNY